MDEFQSGIVLGGQEGGFQRYINVLQIDLFRSILVKSMTPTVTNLTLKAVLSSWGTGCYCQRLQLRIHAVFRNIACKTLAYLFFATNPCR